MNKAHTSDLICGSSEEMLNSAGHLYQAEHSIPPSDLQITYKPNPKLPFQEKKITKIQNMA